MDELQVVRELLPEQPPPSAEVVANAVARLAAGKPRRRQPGYRRVYAGVIAAAAAVAVGGATLLISGGHPAEPRSSAQRNPDRAALSPAGNGASSPPRTLPRATGRMVLLAAAAHVRATASTGRYWRVTEISTQVVPGGTQRHPYDLLVRELTDQWAARAPDQLDWTVSQRLSAAPLSAADMAAWRADGSPTSWPGLGPNGRGTPLTMGPNTAIATSQPGHAIVGYVEADLPGLTASQFRAIPHTVPSLRAYLYRVAGRLWSAQHPGSGGATATQLVWAEAVNLLQDPVTAQVRAAAFRVLAALPGVRLLGQVRDPLGQYGYELRGGTTGVGGEIFVDPFSGALLATLYAAPIQAGPSMIWVRCTNAGGSHTIQAAPGRLYGTALAHGCKLATSVWFGRTYNGPLNGLNTVKWAGWTNANPPLPATRP